MNRIDTENIKRLADLDVEIRNIKGYFTFGRRHIWLNSNNYVLETNSEMFCRALSIISIAVPLFLAYSLYIAHNEKEKIQASIHPFEFLHDELILIIQSFCPFKERLALTATSSKIRKICHSDPHFRQVEKIAMGLSSQLCLKGFLEVEYFSTLHYNPCFQEIFVGQEIDYKHKGREYVLRYGLDLKLLEKLPLENPYSYIFRKSIEQIIPAKEGNLILMSRNNECKIVYWNVRDQKIYEIKEFGQEAKWELNIVYSPAQSRFYAALQGKVEIYEESETHPLHIDTITVPNQPRISRIEIDEKLNILWMIADGTLLEYDLTSEQFQILETPLKVSSKLIWDAEMHWLIGKIGPSTTVWDLQKKAIACEVPISANVMHYNKDKKWLFLFNQGIQIWDMLQQDWVATPMFEKLIELDALDFDPASNVLIGRKQFDGFILAWDMVDGTLLPISPMKADQFIWDKNNGIFIKILNGSYYSEKSISVHFLNYQAPQITEIQKTVDH